MKLTLTKIYCHDENKSLVHLSIEADYGWKEDMCKDIIQINYNGAKREAFITVKLKNSGIGKIVDRLIEIITEMDFTAPSVKNPPLFLVEHLAEKISLEYNPLEVERALSEFKKGT